MKNWIYLSVLISSVTFFTSCSDDDTVEKPTINLITPEQGKEYEINKIVNLKIQFSAGKIGILRYGFLVYSDDNVNEKFEYKKTLDVNVLLNEFTIDHSFTIPETGLTDQPVSSANYKIKIFAYNTKGMYSELIREIKVKEVSQVTE